MGVSQDAVQKLEDSDFRGLPMTLELAVGARVILFHNLCVLHGLMNGTAGKIIWYCVQKT